MTLAEAINCIHSGDTEGFHYLFQATAPQIWLAISLLGGDKMGYRMTEIYRVAQEKTAQLHSPSDLRSWLCKIAYPMLLQEEDSYLTLSGKAEHEVYFRLLTALPREERTAVLLLCGEGCTAAQAAQILSQPEIEIKRAMRRARASLAELAKNQMCFRDVKVNTPWILQQTTQLRTELAQNTDTFDRVWSCIEQGTVYTEPKPAEQEPREERPGFFHKLFRTKRFS